MSMLTANPLEAFHWEPQPAAQALVRHLVNDFIHRNSFAAMFATRLRDEAGVRFVDLISQITRPFETALKHQLMGAGYEIDDSDFPHEPFVNRGGIFPRIVFAGDSITRVAFKVENVVDFLATWNLSHAMHIIGEPVSPLRGVCVAREGATELWAEETHGWQSRERPEWSSAKTANVLLHRESFRTRQRNFETDDQGFAHLHRLIDAAIADIGVAYTCDLFFAAEREYWQRRNRAAQVQKARQDRLGIGWANHDHHTYRSSRQHFASLVALWEKLGFQCRERFYAGREAGWGAQVMEQSTVGIITFNDVDLSPDELMGDFSHDGLAPQDKLGTVGLWCALHGEAVLQAGMHHLEGMFEFDSLRDQLAVAEVNMMKPFTDFPYLRQAFTEGERWPVAENRIAAALSAGYITQEQAKQFREQGALGSHLENLERNDGFKGFNQTGVSEIIAATDPRKNLDKVTR